MVTQQQKSIKPYPGKKNRMSNHRAPRSGYCGLNPNSVPVYSRNQKLFGPIPEKTGTSSQRQRRSVERGAGGPARETILTKTGVWTG